RGGQEGGGPGRVRAPAAAVRPQDAPRDRRIAGRPGTAGFLLTSVASQVDDADVRQSVEHQLHPQRGEQEPEHLLGHQHPARVQLAADRRGPAEHHDVEHEHHDEHAHGDAQDGERAGLGRQGDQDHDPGRVEQVGHGQREDGDLHGVPADELVATAGGDAVAAAGGVALAEHHGGRDDQQDDAAGDAERARREVQQPGKQAAEDQQQRGDQGGGGQHLAPDAALGGFRHARGHAEERNQRDLGPDPDQEQQDRVDDEGGVQRSELFHPGTLDHTGPAAERNTPQLTPTG